jgi:phosphatidylserine/phosphatidylglycerophosphate/cardiolipin synthase-like enzyme
MRPHAALLFAVLLTLPVTAGASFFSEDAPPPPMSAAGATFETAFSPAGAVSPAVVKALAGAGKSIRVSAREFTSKPVSEALVKAARAGRDVKVVLSRKNNLSPLSAAQFLLTMSYPPHLTISDDSLYTDYIVIDERDVILGDIAGFTDEEEEKKHAANVIIIRNAPELAKQYLAHWQRLWTASSEMQRDKN